jgi:hypothetical protein
LPSLFGVEYLSAAATGSETNPERNRKENLYGFFEKWDIRCYQTYFVQVWGICHVGRSSIAQGRRSGIEEKNGKILFTVSYFQLFHKRPSVSILIVLPKTTYARLILCAPSCFDVQCIKIWLFHVCLESLKHTEFSHPHCLNYFCERFIVLMSLWAFLKKKIRVYTCDPHC